MTREEIIARTMQLEGGYVNDPNDKGGETKFGISKRIYPSLDIQNLTEADAVEIYKKDYYDPRLDSIVDDTVRGKVFDMGVNIGQFSAIKILQSILPVWPVDGILGNDTIQHTNAYSGNLHDQLRRGQLIHYALIVKANPTQVQFLVGWINRTFAT